MNQSPIVYVVDDDPGVRDSLAMFGTAVGMRIETFASGHEFLEGLDVPPSRPACLILDVQMPGLDGYAVRERLQRAGWRPPTVFISAYDDERERVATLQGRVGFLRKPFPIRELMNHVERFLVEPSDDE